MTYTIPTFPPGSGATSAKLTQVSACLTALNSSLQMGAALPTPLAGNGPPTQSPGLFGLPITGQSVTALAGDTIVTLAPAGFSNGLLVVLFLQAEYDSGTPGLMVQRNPAGVHTSASFPVRFSAGGTPVTSGTHLIDYLAIGW